MNALANLWLVNWKLKTIGMNPATESFLILHRFGYVSQLFDLLSSEDEWEVTPPYLLMLTAKISVATTLAKIEVMRLSASNILFTAQLIHLLVVVAVAIPWSATASTPMNSPQQTAGIVDRRKPLSERLSDLKCSVLLITGALAPQRRGCEKLYEALMKVHSAKSCATRELVVVENVANVLAEKPDKVIESMQYFLQGIGLVSHIKMQTTPLNLNRRMSMEDYDKPMGRIQLAGGFRPNLAAPNDVAEESSN
ncbi:Ndr family protein [Echinococcus multilocularis]|uniref:Ndr family protein n=1 Tax=Echinococcus multilocularis TaxID=6211 RepID=A0A068YHV3_ECHMU|nr:Ndr family protein [Echinococcus multilocularis]